MRTFAETAEFAVVAGIYHTVRAQRPDVPAKLAHEYARDGGNGLTLDQLICERTTGHDFPRDIEERDRCLCANCGADGDA